MGSALDPGFAVRIKASESRGLITTIVKWRSPGSMSAGSPAHRGLLRKGESGRLHLLGTSVYGGREASKQVYISLRRSTVGQNTGVGAQEKDSSNASKLEESKANVPGPPFLTILAGIVVLVAIFWILSSLGSWVIKLL